MSDQSALPPPPPTTGEASDKPWWRKYWWALALGAVVVIGGIGAAVGGGEDDGTDAGEITEPTAESADTTTATETTETAPETTEPPQTTEASTTTAAPTTTAPPTTTTPPPAAEPILFTGTGTQVLTLNEGSPESVEALTVLATHDGTSNFQVTLLDDGGERIDGLINTIGEYVGKRPWNFFDGNVVRFVEVEADGNWSLTLNALTDSANQTTFVGQSGETLTTASDQVLITNTDGPFVADFVCQDCISNIQLRTYGESGRDILVNEIGEGVPYQTSFVIPAGTLIIEVETSGYEFRGDAFVPGNWTLTLQ